LALFVAAQRFLRSSFETPTARSTAHPLPARTCRSSYANHLGPLRRPSSAGVLARTSRSKFAWLSIDTA